MCRFKKLNRKKFIFYKFSYSELDNLFFIGLEKELTKNSYCITNWKKKVRQTSYSIQLNILYSATNIHYFFFKKKKSCIANRSCYKSSKLE